MDDSLPANNASLTSESDSGIPSAEEAQEESTNTNEVSESNSKVDAIVKPPGTENTSSMDNENPEGESEQEKTQNEIEESATGVTRSNTASNTTSRTALQPTKRRPDKDLNHQNWDEEDIPEEKGEFKKASDDQLKERKILTAKRKKPATQPSANPFGSLAGFGEGPGSTFSFEIGQPKTSASAGFGGGPSATFSFDLGQPTKTSDPAAFDFSILGSNTSQKQVKKGSQPKNESAEQDGGCEISATTV